MVKQARTSKQSYLEVVGTDIRIPVPDDPEGERKAVAAHPEFKRLLEAARQAEAEGRLVPMEDAFAQLDAEIPLSPRQSKGTPGRTSSAGAPSPTRRGRPPADEPQGRLLIPSDRIVVRYRLDTPNVKSPAGTLFVRGDTQRRFRQIALRATGPVLSARVPKQVLRGHKLFYYAVIREPKSGRSVTLPRDLV